MQQEVYSFFDPEVLREAQTLLDQSRQRSFRKEETPDGRLRLSARYPDRFNFVDRAQLILSADGSCVDSSRCDCTGRSATSFCLHCAALLLRLEQEEPSLVSQSAAGEEKLPVVADEPVEVELPPVGEGEPGPSIRDLTYSFTNCAAHLYPGVQDPWIPLRTFEMVFGRNLIAARCAARNGRWGGSCFGMVSSSSMFYHPGNNVSVPDYHRGASIPAELKLDDRNRGLNLSLHTFIEAMQVSQLGVSTNALRQRILRTSMAERLRVLCEQVEAFEANGTAPIIMEVYQNDRYDGGHAVLPFRHERIDRLRSRLHIYDPNIPGKVRYCDLRQDRTGNYTSWRFLMSNDFPYSSDTGGVISYLPHEVYQSLWDHRAEPQVTAVFSTSCEDLSVQDEAGNEVLKISDGRMTSLRDDVIPIRATDGDDSAGIRECWLNPGTYRVVNEDPEQELSFTFTGQNGEVEVETDAEEVLCTVDDEQDIQQAEVVKSSKASKLKAFLRSTVKQIFIRVTSDVGTKLLLLGGKLLLNLILGGTVSCFQVNGQNADVRDYQADAWNETEAEKEKETEEDTEEEDEALLCTGKPADPEPADPGEA